MAPGSSRRARCNSSSSEASAPAALRWALGRRLSLVVAGGLDVLAARAMFSVNQEPVLSTAWVVPWLGAGLGWETAL